MKSCIVLIAAAGSGQRLGGEVPKQYLALAGVPLLRRTVEAFLGHPDITGVRVVISPEHCTLYDRATAGLPLLPPVAGGATRQASVCAGLESLVPQNPDYVLIHDGARPFADRAIIQRTVAALATSLGAIAAVAVTDTLKRGTTGCISDTVDRRDLWRAQTPQGFHFGPILAAHRAAIGIDCTDDAAVAERSGMAVAIVPGSEDNFKVTTTDDIRRAERQIAAPAWEFRNGMGYDVHRFVPGDGITLCGIKVPHDQALEGHSDADAGLHALTDALLGAIASGDIGSHFPPSDPQWRGVDSARFLAHAAELVARKGGKVLSVDITVICERPKIGPHRDAMATRIAAILGIERDRVSVKATTTEGLGFTGRREGIAAQAIVSLALPASFA